jgi:UDP-2,3-diacylglucosamine pyrophosphatase LpxH
MKELSQIVQKAKELFHELGRTPLRLELEAAGASKYIIQRVGYAEIINMAGLEALNKSEKMMARKAHKITNEIFLKSIDNQIEEYSPRVPVKKNKFPKILCIPDTHFPFINKEALDLVIDFAKNNNPDYIIQVGDLLDCYAASKFPRSQNIYTPKEEERLGIEMASDMWKRLKKHCPKAKCYQLMGNHDVRMLKRTLESLPIAEHWIEKYFKELFSFEGVETIFDTRQELDIEGILFTHGFLGAGSHKDYYLKNVIHGHDHKLYVHHRRIHGENIFEMSCGFLGDVEAKALSYTPSKLANFQLGFGWVDQWGARTIHL